MYSFYCGRWRLNPMEATEKMSRIWLINLFYQKLTDFSLRIMIMVNLEYGLSVTGFFPRESLKVKERDPQLAVCLDIYHPRYFDPINF